MSESTKLRAKATSQAPALGDPSSSAGLKEPKPREEGELSSGDDEDVAARSFSVCDNTAVGHSHVSVDIRPEKRSKIGNGSSAPNFHLRKTVLQNHRKRFRAKQAPFKATNSRNLCWQKKGLDENLVISFSEDDSASDSEKVKPDETQEKNGTPAGAYTHKMPSMPHRQNIVREETRQRMNQDWKRGPTTQISTVKNIGARSQAASFPKLDPQIQRHHSFMRTSASQTDGNVGGANFAVTKLENLRQEIALRENALKVQKKSVPISSEGFSDSCAEESQLKSNTQSGIELRIRAAPMKNVELLPSVRPLKRHKLDHQYLNSRCSDDQLQVAATCTNSVKDNGNQFSNGQLQLAVTSTESGRANSKQPVNSSLEDRSTSVCHASNMESSLVQTNMGNNLQYKEAVKNVPVSSEVHYAVREAIVTSVPTCELHLSPVDNVKMPSEQEQNGIIAADSVQFRDDDAPANSSMLFNQNTDMMKLAFGMKNTNLLTCTGQTDISGQGSQQLQSLLEMEEVQDKELEEAQERRHRCELEERQALKAYRKAQQALMEANERCAILYRKRELLSAGLHNWIMENSGSIWSSCWQNDRDTMLDSLNISKASHDIPSMVGHMMSSEQQILGQVGDKPKLQPPDDGAPHQQIDNDDLISDQSRDIAASTSDPKGIHAMNDVSAPADALNLSPDDEEENFPFHIPGSSFISSTNMENRADDTINVDTEQAALQSNDNALDYELLEASLRSKLVARFGKKGSKNAEISSMDCLVDKAAKKEHNRESDQQLLGTENNMTNIEGTLEPCRQIEDVFLKDPCWSSCKTPSHLPPSVLHNVSRHIKWILTHFSRGSSTITEDCRKSDVICKGAVNMLDEHDPADGHGRISPVSGEKGNDALDLGTDLFWPFCMFELRGKCNDESCQWQHFESCVWRKSKLKDGSIDSSSGQLSSGSLQYFLPVPTYRMGPLLINADYCLLWSMLASGVWQYWQRGFCASFPLPISVQRILPPDAPFLQTDDASIADYQRNRHSSYFRSPDATMKKLLQEIPDAGESLELVLEFYSGKAYKLDWKKALSLLARAIEAEPNSVVVWIVYLHIYYQKQKQYGSDDMFFHAVRHNLCSYELWLLYINSRLRLDERVNAYKEALSTFCHMTANCGEEVKDRSMFILDISLQMMNFLCMCGRADSAISQIYGLLPTNNFEHSDEVLANILQYLLISDRCIFLVCCVYLLIYRKLPNVILGQLEMEKDLPFGIEWPSTELATNNKGKVLELMKFAVDMVISDVGDNFPNQDPFFSRSAHLIAVTHIRCVAALEGLDFTTNFLAKYTKLFPTCIDILLISVRLGESHNRADAVFGRFEEVLFNWPRKFEGIQCLWNQYAEHLLANRRVDVAEQLMLRWFQQYGDVTDLDSDSRENIFWFLNLSLLRILQNNLQEAQVAVDKALKMADHKLYMHCLREHAGLYLLNKSVSCEDITCRVVLDLLSGHLGDCRSLPVKEPLSRRYYRDTKKPRIRQLIDDRLGPVSADFSPINSVLEVCYGPSLLPEEVMEPKGLVDFVESVMQITPANYPLALSVCRLAIRKFSHGDAASSKCVLFWASSVLVSSVFQALPVASETVWLEAASLLENLRSPEISRRFLQQATSVYPFSIKLWQSYLNLSKITGDTESIVVATRERGLNL